MDRVIAEQRKLTGIVPCVFRPPYGDYHATTLRFAQRRRMAVWLWSPSPLSLRQPARRLLNSG
jgi:peptidoglycan/xylan/chitin deacetylase (PgdA/CDA1 family)